jgi:hypothetical protein
MPVGERKMAGATVNPQFGIAIGASVPEKRQKELRTTVAGHAAEAKVKDRSRSSRSGVLIDRIDSKTRVSFSSYGRLSRIWCCQWPDSGPATGVHGRSLAEPVWVAEVLVARAATVLRRDGIASAARAAPAPPPEPMVNGLPVVSFMAPQSVWIRASSIRPANIVFARVTNPSHLKGLLWPHDCLHYAMNLSTR